MASVTSQYSNGHAIIAPLHHRDDSHGCGKKKNQQQVDGIVPPMEEDDEMITSHPREESGANNTSRNNTLGDDANQRPRKRSKKISPKTQKSENMLNIHVWNTSEKDKLFVHASSCKNERCQRKCRLPDVQGILRTYTCNDFKRQHSHKKACKANSASCKACFEFETLMRQHCALCKKTECQVPTCGTMKCAMRLHTRMAQLANTHGVSVMKIMWPPSPRVAPQKAVYAGISEGKLRYKFVSSGKVFRITPEQLGDRILTLKNIRLFVTKYGFRMNEHPVSIPIIGCPETLEVHEPLTNIGANTVKFGKTWINKDVFLNSLRAFMDETCAVGNRISFAFRMVTGRLVKRDANVKSVSADDFRVTLTRLDAGGRAVRWSPDVTMSLYDLQHKIALLRKTEENTLAEMSKRGIGTNVNVLCFGSTVYDAPSAFSEVKRARVIACVGGEVFLRPMNKSMTLSDLEKRVENATKQLSDFRQRVENDPELAVGQKISSVCDPDKFCAKVEEMTIVKHNFEAAVVHVVVTDAVTHTATHIVTGKKKNRLTLERIDYIRARTAEWEASVRETQALMSAAGLKFEDKVEIFDEDVVYPDVGISTVEIAIISRFVWTTCRESAGGVRRWEPQHFLNLIEKGRVAVKQTKLIQKKANEAGIRVGEVLETFGTSSCVHFSFVSPVKVEIVRVNARGVTIRPKDYDISGKRRQMFSLKVSELKKAMEGAKKWVPVVAPETKKTLSRGQRISPHELPTQDLLRTFQGIRAKEKSVFRLSTDESEAVFRAHRAHLRSLNLDTRTMWLFHGSGDYEGVVESGGYRDTGVLNARSYGQGVYFCSSIDMSMMRKYSPPRGVGGYRCVFVNHVIVGNTCETMTVGDSVANTKRASEMPKGCRSGGDGVCICMKPFSFLSDVHLAYAFLFRE